MDTRGHVLPFRDLLRQHRIAAGLSQERLAERAGLSARAVSDLERGLRRTPRLETVRMLSDALDLGAEERAGMLQAARSNVDGKHDVLPVGAPVSRARLPIPPTPLIGREQEISRLLELLLGVRTRLISLTGTGGVGKTRVALETGKRAAGKFGDGVVFVDLATVEEPALVERAIADALEPDPGAAPDPAADIALAVGERHMLLILDNFEHVVTAAPVVAGLLARCPAARILVTSRVPLDIRGEHQFPVPALRAPDAHSSRLDDALGADAVRLFLDRARDVRPDFKVDEENAGVIAAICRRLDGIPLALELAAVRVKMLPPPLLLARLERSLPLLTGGPVDLPARHQTLRGTVAWSHDLLEPRERIMFRRLAVFAGGSTLEAIEEVVDPDGDIDVFEVLASLINKNMVRSAGVSGSGFRYSMLETIREFALEQFRESGDVQEIGRRHAGYYVTLAQTGAANLADTTGEDSLARLEAEQANMRAALAWLRDEGMYGAGLRLAIALGPFWRMRNAVSEGRAWLETFLTTPLRGTVPDADLIVGLQWAGELAALQGEHVAAARRLHESLALARKLGDEQGIAAAVGALASLHVQSGEIAVSIPLFEEALAVSRRMGNRRVAAFMSSYMAFAVAHQGDLAHARSLMSESRAHLRALGDVRSFEADLAMMVDGWIAYLAGNPEEAMQWFAEAISLGRAIDAGAILATTLAGMGEVAMVLGQIEEAVAHYREGLRLGWDARFPTGVVTNLQGLARIAARRGDEEVAARLIGAAMVFGTSIDALPGRGRLAYGETVEHVRRVLGERFDVERVRGETMRPDETVKLASVL